MKYTDKNIVMPEGKSLKETIKFTTLLRIDPKAALERKFKEQSTKRCLFKDKIFIWTSVKDKTGIKSYGSYKYVSKKMLKDRQFIIYQKDYDLAIEFTDIYHIPKYSTNYCKYTNKIRHYYQ